MASSRVGKLNREAQTSDTSSISSLMRNGSSGSKMASPEGINDLMHNGSSGKKGANDAHTSIGALKRSG